ncbi:hypothetical protein OBBRIDRAFT_314470 [Obba rivulosa]|uniref:Uncharacterized protein n=1 Tax=Obba rivulosa TaxID=1052685 RepID=A0A8E2DFY4_9APHY|nr:hypothetical protein OBBRIDRAFT_314470 [Obba rivulosa]
MASRYVPSASTSVFAAHNGLRKSSGFSFFKFLSKPGSLKMTLVAMVQCHLTFGVTEAVTELKVPEDLLLGRMPSGDLVMTTSRLHLILHYFIYRIHDLKITDSEARRRRFERGSMTLSIARNHFECREADRRGNYLVFPQAVLHPDNCAKIMCMIVTAHEAPSDVVCKHFRITPSGVTHSRSFTGPMADI